jgi:tetratricopeptide (TPR) repeat protein
MSLRPLAGALFCLALWAGLGATASARTDEAQWLMESGKADDALRAAELYEARVAQDPDDFASLLGAAQALTQAMAIRTNGNLPLVDGLQDTEANRALWAELAPRALEHARKAHALRVESIEAASAVATSYMFYSSSLGIVRAILEGSGGEYRANAQRLIDMDPKYDDGLGDTLLANFYLVAPWPIGDDDLALEHFDHAARLTPESVRNQYGLAVYWARQGDEARARRHFQHVVDRPCTKHSERLICDWMKQTAKRELGKLGG